MTALLADVLALLPPGTKPLHTVDRMGGGLQAHFSTKCAGNIERAWPSIYDLCVKCGCLAQLIARDSIETTAILDTRSGAPNYSTRSFTEVVLVLSEAEEMRRAA